MAYILAGIPKPVIGAVFLISAASIMFSGIDSIVSSPRTLRNTLVAGDYSDAGSYSFRISVHLLIKIGQTAFLHF